MTIDVEELLALPEMERWALVELLSASLSDETDFDLTEEELAETRRRLDACRENPARPIPAAEVLESVRRHRAG